MALEGPRVVYTRREEESPLERALRLACEIEELLAETTSAAEPDLEGPQSSVHGPRIARAMAAGLVDELRSLDRVERKRRLC